MIFIGLGSNLGIPVANLCKALDYLTQSNTLIKVSSFYETAPLYFLEGGNSIPQPNYINAVVQIQTKLSPLDLLDALLQIEYTMGRRRTTKWAARIIDLDLLVYEDFICTTDTLMLPHPHLHTRTFVLEPWREISPDFIVPKWNISVNALYQNLVKDSLLSTKE